MIAVTPNSDDNTIYVDYRNKILCPDHYFIHTKNSKELRFINYKPDPEDITEEFNICMDNFIYQNGDLIINPIYYFIDRYQNNMANCHINVSDFGSIYYFLMNFRINMLKSKYYEKILNVFCDKFNSSEFGDLYIYIDEIQFIVYDKNKEDYYQAIDHIDKEPEIVLFKDYNEKNNIRYDKKQYNALEELFKENIKFAESKSGYPKNLVFTVLFDFASTVKNYPMLILNSEDLK